MTKSRYWDWSLEKFAEMKAKFNHAYTYDETSESGLRWKNPNAQRCKPGDVAGCLKPDGYWYVRFEGIDYKVHQVIWIMEGNIISKGKELDHIDRNRSNNCRSNLQLVSRSENGKNKNPYGKSKFKGVSWHKQKKKWRADIKIDGKQKYIGIYETEEEAARAWDAEAFKLGRNDLNFPA